MVVGRAVAALQVLLSLGLAGAHIIIHEPSSIAGAYEDNVSTSAPIEDYTINALVAANEVIIPVQCEYYALEGLAKLLKTIDALRQTLRVGVEIHGVLRTMYDGRNLLTRQVSEQLMQSFPDKVYQTVIPRNIRLAEAPSHGMPILAYDKRSQGAASYLAFAAEMIRRSKATQEKLVPMIESEEEYA